MVHIKWSQKLINSIICSIPNFSLRPEKASDYIISPTFVMGSKERSEWCLLIYLNGQNEKYKEYVSVYLVLKKPNKVKVKFRLSILNDEEGEGNVCNVKNVVDLDKGQSWGFPKFVKNVFLLNKWNGLLVNDTLTIICETEIIDFKSENHDNLDTSINVTTPQSKLSLDYGNMFESSLFYDCVIKVEDTEIKVHKAVLATRSPAFYDIFNSTSDESQTNIIEIRDFNIEVVREMLKYIYTDEVSDIQDMANEMFEVANKYELDRLKAISEQFMCNSLTNDNVLERFALSDKCPTERLKECCEGFILKNVECVTKAMEWENFVHVHPSLIGSLFLKAFNISSKESNSEKKDKE